MGNNSSNRQYTYHQYYNAIKNDKKFVIFFQNEIELLIPSAKTFLALGSLAWNSIYQTLKDLGCDVPKPKPTFGHAASYTFKGADGLKRKVLGCYHPSQQNTFTGKLTEKMLDSVIKKAANPA